MSANTTSATAPTNASSDTQQVKGTNGVASQEFANGEKSAVNGKPTDTSKVNGANGSNASHTEESSSINGSGDSGSLVDTSHSIVHRKREITAIAPATAVVSAGKRSLDENIRQYAWSYGPDQIGGPDSKVFLPYPPHAVFGNLPAHEQKSMEAIFNKDILESVRGVLKGVDKLYFRLPTADQITGDWTLRQLAEANRECFEEYKKLKAAGHCPDDKLNPLFTWNIADRDDWFTDATFAQQHFTGPNPTTITIASGAWISRFKQAATDQVARDVVAMLTKEPQNFYVQDNSYFRAAMRLNANVELKSTLNPQNPADAVRYACASVSLFHLEDDGMLQPVAIILDWRGDMASSVTIFNRRLHSTDSQHYEETDWPWRYAKMCAQSSDWLRHEVTVHLTNTHLVEEAVIVSAHRTLPPDHVVFKIMKEHWSTTLAVNQGARGVLIPAVILPLSGIDGLPLVQFLQHAYESFDWQGLYIPNDLDKRGFPMSALEHDPRFRNYAYGRNMALMWPTLRKFVASVISEAYQGRDANVEADPYLSAFCAEMRSAARLSTFPEVKTLDGLIDMVTMCIHIAAPNHTAVNYLQHYYQVFVPNKPPALYRPLPRTLRELLGVNESFITRSLPGAANIRDWQLAALLPFLLSEEVVGDQSFMQYAKDVASGRIAGLETAGKDLQRDLENLKEVFKRHSCDLAPHHPNTWYMVMDPDMTANSILI